MALRLLVVSPYFAPSRHFGGPVRSLETLCAGLAARGVEVTVATTDADGPARLDTPAVRSHAGATVHTVRHVARSVRGLASYVFAPGLVPLLRRLSRTADVIHLEGAFYFSVGAGAAIARALDRPYVIVPRGSLDRWSLAQKAWKKRAYLGLGGRRTLTGAAALICTSAAEREQAPHWLRAVPAVVVPNGLRLHPLAPRDELRERLGLPASTRLFGMAGRIHPKKGFDVLLPALARLPRHADVRLLLAGPDGHDHLRAVLAQAAALGLGDRVRHLGTLETDALQTFYAGLDALLLPSHEENFGNVVIEAVAQGTPVLVSDEVALADWVCARGAGERLPLRSEAWATRLAALLAGQPLSAAPADRLAALARKDFDHREVAARAERVYQAIARRERPTDATASASL